MPRRRIWTVGAVLAVFAAAIAVAIVIMRAPDSAPDTGDVAAGKDTPSAKGAPKLHRAAPRKEQSPGQAVGAVMPKGLARRRKRPAHEHQLFEHLNGKDRTCAEALQAALDEDDFARVQKATEAALASTNAEVRLNAVEALGWFGAQALPELTEAMADRDEDVRQAAANHWEQALQEIEAPGDRFQIAVAAIGSLSNEETLTSIGGLLGNAASELIDGEDDPAKAAENRIRVVQALADIIEDGKAKNRAAAQEAYREITGESWEGLAAAENYLRETEEDEFEWSREDDPQDDGSSQGDDGDDAGSAAS